MPPFSMLNVIMAGVKSSVKIFTVIGCVINRPHFKNRLCVCVVVASFTHAVEGKKTSVLVRRLILKRE